MSFSLIALLGVFVRVVAIFAVVGYWHLSSFIVCVCVCVCMCA